MILSFLHRSRRVRVRGRRMTVVAGLLLVLVTWTVQGVHAQEEDEGTQPGQVRAQGRVIENPGLAIPPTEPGGMAPDYREEMRLFVQAIGEYARNTTDEFWVVAEDALPLVTKRDLTEETIGVPARAFIRSIDGVLATGLFHGETALNEPAGGEENTEEEALHQQRLRLAEVAEENGLTVMALDFADEPETINAGYRMARERGFVYHAVPTRTLDAVTLPRYPARPFAESPASVLSLDDISNYALVTNSADYGRQDEFALRMHGNNYDVLIVDVFHGREPLTKQAVETLKYKKTGSRRQVLARVDIGHAASYRYYWQPTWGPGSPVWIEAPEEGNPDSYVVEFWRPEWQAIIYGDTQSYIYGVIDQGYDGVVLTGLDVFEFFEGGADFQF